MNTKDCIQVTTTVDSRKVAERICREMVEQRLAACGQITGPIASMYWWHDVLESAAEWRIDFKTRANLYPALEAAIIALHPYDTPEIIATPIVTGSPRYLKWLRDETAQE